MKKINICIIGAGNISNTRHIPSLKKNKYNEIIGIISDRQKNIDRTLKNVNCDNYLLLEKNDKDFDKLKKCKWFNSVDAVVIGAPPQEHFRLVEMCLRLGKHVLVEKPMTMNKEEAETLIKLSTEKNLIFSVVHNFQYASGMQKLTEIIENKKYGDIVSIMEVQCTNRDRRLPEWYNDLPMGLFYDEAAHFIYLLEKHGGNLKINNSYATYNKKGDNTPLLLSVNATAGKVPVQMILNFNTPICEWWYCVVFKNHIAYYDFFKDILLVIPSDNEHYAKDVINNSFRYTFQYWSKFVVSGFKMVTKNLLYGHDILINKFIESVQTGRVNEDFSAKQGLKNVISMNEIVDKANKK